MEHNLAYDNVSIVQRIYIYNAYLIQDYLCAEKVITFVRKK